MVGSPLGKCVEVNKVCRSCIIGISYHKLVVDLMILELMEYDVILGMDLTQFKAILDCGRKMVTITLSEGKHLVSMEVGIFTSILDNGNCNYLRSIAHMVTEDLSNTKLELIPIVKDFGDVFPEELYGIPLEMEFFYRYLSWHVAYIYTSTLNGTSRVEGTQNTTSRT
ncbi:hypothetical protein L3X38_024239 [Prunus dulcis]|uniref:Uncharacterized protein n=1 Tax=Prunus dulcis TaxID=3755 RepID=A0AAD4W088_PRUDU|nr:hypothetical protein L3X38_024239 [Prunus dulcis]